MKRFRYPLLLLLFTLIYFQPLFFGKTLYYRDLHLNYYPKKCFEAQMLRRGEMPLWNPLIHGGQSLAADPNALLFHPETFLYVLLPPLAAMNTTIVLHLLLALLGMFLLARALGFSPFASLMAALIFGFSGPTLALTNMVHQFYGMAYLPWVLWAWTTGVKEGRPSGSLLTALLLSLQVVAGAPEVAAITGFYLILWTLAYRPKKIRAWLRLAGVTALAILLAGITVIPVMEGMQSSHRKKGLTYEEVTYRSHPLSRLPEILLADWYGLKEYRDTSTFVASPRIDGGGAPYLLNLYLGILTILLIPVALKRSQALLPIPRLMVTLLAVALPIWILLSCGRHLPGFALLYRLVPPLHFFRFPAKMMLGAPLPLALLAALGLKNLSDGSGWKLLRSLLIAATTLTLLLYLLLLYSPSFSTTVQEIFYGTTGMIQSAALSHALRRSLILLLPALAVALFRRKSTLIAALFIAIIAVGDMVTAGRNLLLTTDPAFFSTPPIVRAIEEKIGGGRLYRLMEGESDALIPAEEHYLINQERLAYYIAAQFSIPVIYHLDLDNLTDRTLIGLTELIEMSPWEKKEILLRAGACSAILSDIPINTPGITLAGRGYDHRKKPLYLYTLDNPTPPIVVAQRWVWARSMETAMRAVISPHFDPNEDVVLEGEGDDHLPVKIGESKLADIQITPKRWAVTVTTFNPAFLVFSLPWNPGWKAIVDGERDPILHANIAFSALALKPGTHTVVLRYRPTSLLLGALLSLLGWLILGGLFLISKPHPRRSSGGHPC